MIVRFANRTSAIEKGFSQTAQGILRQAWRKGLEKLEAGVEIKRKEAIDAGDLRLMEIAQETKERKTPLALTPFHGLSLAFGFLSRLPAAKGIDWSDRRVWGWSFAFYPLCGVALGLVASAPAIIMWKLPAAESLMLLSVFYYLAVIEWATRFLHFDGFCDCCDAFSAMTASRERRLEIMKDPHVGSSAVGAAGLLLLGKALTLYLLMYKGIVILDNFPKTIAMLVSIPAAARLAMLCLAAIGRYPREKGTAAMVVGQVPFPALLLGVATVLPFPFLIGLRASALPFLLCAFAMMYWKIKADAKIGGVTGDVLGACVESCELAAAIGLLLALEANL